jgi:hypothetical protein
MMPLDTALSLAARGWRVFPLAPGSKLPVIPAAHPSGSRERTACRGECGRAGHGVHDATTERTALESWWRRCPTANVGVACGPSRLLVLDLDMPKPGQKPAPGWMEAGITCGANVLAELSRRAGEPMPTATYTVRTGRGGLHLYFHAASEAGLGNSAGRLGWLIDTRGVGGYVVAAGSVVAGLLYDVVHDVVPIPLPTWLADRLITQQTRSEATSIHQPAGYARSAMRNEVQRVLDAEEGGRNATLNRAAYSLGTLIGAGLLPEPLARQALHRAGVAVGLAPHEVTATVESGLSAGLARPRPGGAA